MGTCQDEPEQLDDWNRIAELQQRNRVCPPHLKTCYPLESRVSPGASCGSSVPADAAQALGPEPLACSGLGQLGGVTAVGQELGEAQLSTGIQ